MGAIFLCEGPSRLMRRGKAPFAARKTPSAVNTPYPKPLPTIWRFKGISWGTPELPSMTLNKISGTLYWALEYSFGSQMAYPRWRSSLGSRSACWVPLYIHWHSKGLGWCWDNACFVFFILQKLLVRRVVRSTRQFCFYLSCSCNGFRCGTGTPITLH